MVTWTATTNDDQTSTFTLETARLINGYIRHNLTITEHLELDQWVTAGFLNQQILELLTENVIQNHELLK